MNWKSIILVLTIVLGSLFTSLGVEAQELQLAGPTDVGMLYVDSDKTGSLYKDGEAFLTVHAEEMYTDQTFLAELHKDKDLKNVIGAAHLYMFDNKGGSYCVAASYLIDAQGKVCLDYGSDMRMIKLTAKDKTMLNAYTLCLKAMENKKRFQKKF